MRTVSIFIDQNAMWWKANAANRATFEKSMNKLLDWLKDHGFEWKYIRHPDHLIPDELRVYRPDDLLDHAKSR
jgi:hypothetical protein